MNSAFLHLLGQNGTGKSHVAHMLRLDASRSHKIRCIGMGALIRGKADADLGFKSTHEQALSTRALLSNTLVHNMLLAALNCGRGAKVEMIEGYLRNAEQVEKADEAGWLRSLDRVIYLKASDEVCLERLRHPDAAKHRGRRNDDGAVLEGLRVFNANIGSVLHRLAKTQVQIHVVDADQPFEAFFPEVRTLLDHMFKDINRADQATEQVRSGNAKMTGGVGVEELAFA